MIDCSTELNKYWDTKVKLSSEQVSDLRANRNSNMGKLKSRLKDDDFPQPINEINQGSFAMKTIIDHPKNDYDIDVGIVFRKSDLEANGKNNPLEIRKYIAEKMEDERFDKQPDYEKNCVRVYYKKGHHVDMPVYRQYSDSDNNVINELASSTWEKSDPTAINQWFTDEKNSKSNLKQVVQLLKKWAKSRDSWNLPNGLILTILASEKYATEHSRIDEIFYWTIKNLKNRLGTNKRVDNPTNGAEITDSTKHKTRVDNLYSRLNEMFEFLDELETTTDRKKALLLWKKFFDDDFFEQFIISPQESKIITPNSPWISSLE